MPPGYTVKDIERFHDRIHELEVELAEQQQQMAELREENAQLREQSANEHEMVEALRLHPLWSLETSVDGGRWSVTDECFPVSPALATANDPVDAVLAAVKATKEREEKP